MSLVRAPRTRTSPVAAVPLAQALLAAALAAGALPAQVVEPRSPVERTEVGGRIHLQFNTTSVDRSGPGDVPASEFLLRRARLWGAARVNDWIDGAAQIDFSGGKVGARYAFVRFSLDPALRLSFGQFKRPFDLFELTSSSQILVVERDGDVRGVDACPGVGGVCSYSRLTEQLELSSLDVGVLAYGDLAGGRAAYSVSLTNGTGDNALEDNDGKSLSGRFELEAIPGVRLGGNVALHDFDGPGGGVEHAPAAALDVEWGDFDEGWHVQAGVAGGENWRAAGTGGERPSFRAAQAIVTHRFRRAGEGSVAGPRVLAVEPLFRVSWADGNVDDAVDGGWLWTPGVVLHFEGRNKVAANADFWEPGTGGGTAAWSLKLQTYLYF